jgi:hypothetical protein
MMTYASAGAVIGMMIGGWRPGTRGVVGASRGNGFWITTAGFATAGGLLGLGVEEQRLIYDDPWPRP